MPIRLQVERTRAHKEPSGDRYNTDAVLRQSRPMINDEALRAQLGAEVNDETRREYPAPARLAVDGHVIANLMH